MNNKHLKRYPLACLPTPLHSLDKTTELLEAGKMFIKRDDLTGRILGGNKLRKLEYIVSKALEEKADVLVTTGSFESNHVCLTCAVASMLGLKASVVLMGHEDDFNESYNYKIESKLNAEIHKMYYNDENRSLIGQKVSDCVDNITSEIEKNGLNPFFVPGGGCCLEGSYAFTGAFKEMDQQMKTLGHDEYDVVLAVGTGSTFSGLWCGGQLYNKKVNIKGVSIARSNPRCIEETAKACNVLNEYLYLEQVKPDQLDIADAFVGEGYGRKTDISKSGVDLGLKNEGILFDHTYAGKAFGAMTDLIKRKEIGERPIVFWHTGGIAGSIDAEYQVEKEPN
mgnify:CR=1 FL=1